MRRRSSIPPTTVRVLPEDQCQWTGCENRAMKVIRDVRVKPAGSPSEVFVGDVELCGGHLRIAQNLGRVVLDWDLVLAAADGWDPEGVD